MRSLLTMLSFGLCLAVSPAGAAANRVVEVINGTGFTMTEFYASVSSTDSWEEDILRDEVLEDGDAVDINIDDGSGKCVYDFRAVFENGQEAVKRGVNVCRISTFTFTR